MVSPSTSSADLAACIVACVEGGADLRASTSAWANARGEALTVRGAMRQVLDVYDEALAGTSPR